MLPPTPVLLPRYVFNISEGAPLSTSFQLTSPPELPSGVHLEISSEDSDQVKHCPFIVFILQSLFIMTPEIY